MKSNTLFAHLRDILLLPGAVLVLIPYLIFDTQVRFMPEFWSIRAFSLILMTVGVQLFGWSVIMFHRIALATLAPWSVKQRLVTVGPYRYSRNPMITGVLMILIGEGLWLRSMSILCWATTFFIINTLVFIWKEEPYLEKKFGHEYRRYKAKVPRWLPLVTG